MSVLSCPVLVLKPELSLDVAVLQQPMLPLEVSVRQQPLLPLDVLVSVVRQTLLSVCVYSIASCAISGRVCSAATYAATGQICSKAACAVPRGVRPTAACAAHVLSVYKSLCFIWTCLSTRAFVLHQDDLLTRALSCTGRVCLQENVVARVRVCLQTLCDAPGHVCLQESSPRCTCMCVLLRCIFKFVSVCFETCMFVSVVSIHVRNTETSRKKYFLVS